MNVAHDRPTASMKSNPMSRWILRFDGIFLGVHAVCLRSRVQ
jgi:hypothetical protein